MINQPRIKTVFISTLLFSMLVCTFFSERSLAFVVSKTESTGAEIKWQIPSETYYVNASGGPSGSLSAVQAALQTWTEVPSSSFVFLYGGLTEKVCYDVNLDPDHERGTDDDPGDYGLNDGLNIICFGPMGVNGTLAENTFWFYSSGQLVDSDIQLNTSYPYATDGSASSYDVQSLATHESGHSLSLGNLYGASDVEKTMYGYGTKGDISKRTLHQDDIDGISYLYPAYSSQPPSVQTATASSVAADTARLNGSINPNGLSTSYYFQYGTTASYGLATSTGLAGNGTFYVSVSKEISALSPGMTYHFRLVATNDSGTSYGGDSTFTTTAPPSVQTVDADSVTASSARLNGSVNPNGATTTYYFQYGTTASYGLATATAQAGSGVDQVSVSAVIASLSQQTTYHFRLIGTNSAGTFYGEDRSLTTLVAPNVKTNPATAIKSSSASGITSSSAQLNGAVNPNGSDTEYYFEYGSTPSFGSKTQVSQAGSLFEELEVSAPITGLRHRHKLTIAKYVLEKWCNSIPHEMNYAVC